MKKWILPVLVISLVLIIVIIYYVSTPKHSSNLDKDNMSSPEEEQTPFTFPFLFPSSGGTTQNKSGGSSSSSGGSKNTSGGGSGGSSGSGGSGSGGGTTDEPSQKINHTLYVESFPELQVFVNYSVNGVVFTEANFAPYSIAVDGNTYVCAAAYGITGGSGTLRWELDGSDCQLTMCYAPYYGCNVLMDSDHTVKEYFTPTPS